METVAVETRVCAASASSAGVVAEDSWVKILLALTAASRPVYGTATLNRK